MDFRQKKATAARIAKVQHIQTYRDMLKARGSSVAGRIMLDKEALARSLVYNLLDFYTEEQIHAATASQSPAMTIPQATAATVQSIKKKNSKAEEYPAVAWADLDDPLVRTADSIYSDRINCHRALAELERKTQGALVLDSEILEEIVFTSIRMELCFSELRAFNNTGAFLGRHPFIAQADERSRVTALLVSDPDAYFEERKNIDLNITRYQSQINSKKTSKEQKERAQSNLEKYKARLELYKEILKNRIQS